MRRFPSGKYGRQRLQFQAAPFRAPLRAFAALVFPWIDDHVVVCDIIGRGWCIPSGRVEPHETSLEAARREAIEEAGVTLGVTEYIGCYQITERAEVRWADCYAATVDKMGSIMVPEESRGRKLVTLDDLPEIYHMWNPLTQLVFELSHEVITRRTR